MASWLRWVAGGLCLLATAVTQAGEASEYSRETQEFERLASVAKDENAMPRISDPKGARLLARLSDMTLLDHKDYRISDLDDLMSICRDTNRVTKSYTLFGLKNSVSPNIDPKQLSPKVVSLMMRNTTRFQDELTPLMAFSFHCQARSIPPLTEFVKTLKPQQKTAVRRQGLAQFRNGILNMCLGALQISADPSYKESNRVTVLRELAEHAPQFASVLQIEVRAQLITLVREAKMKSPSLPQQYFKAIADAMASTRCEALCAPL